MSLADVVSTVTHRLNDLVEHLRQAGSDVPDDADLLVRFPDVASLTDEEIEEIASGYLSRYDPNEEIMHRVAASLRRLRATARAT